MRGATTLVYNFLLVFYGKLQVTEVHGLTILAESVVDILIKVLVISAKKCKTYPHLINREIETPCFVMII